MKLAQGYMRNWRFKIFLFLALAAILFILTILIESHLGNISVKFD